MFLLLVMYMFEYVLYPTRSVVVWHLCDCKNIKSISMYWNNYGRVMVILTFNWSNYIQVTFSWTHLSALLYSIEIPPTMTAINVIVTIRFNICPISVSFFLFSLNISINYYLCLFVFNAGGRSNVYKRYKFLLSALYAITKFVVTIIIPCNLAKSKVIRLLQMLRTYVDLCYLASSSGSILAWLYLSISLFPPPYKKS